jgi:acetyltransferase-like isoleucine patch superfamily enzyme
MANPLRRLTQNLIRFLKKDSSYKIDSFLTAGDLIQINIRRAMALFRGFFRTFFRKGRGGFLFLGSRVVFRHSHLLSLGRGVVIEDFVTIDALSKKGIQFGDNVKIARFTTIECTGVIRNIGEGVIIGSNSAIGAYSYIGGQGGIRIGENVIMGPRVNFHSENHNYEDLHIPIRLQGETREGIIVEDDCWVGAGSIILDGSYLEKGCIVAAGSVVNKQFPAYSIVGGVPAKIIRSRISS